MKKYEPLLKNFPHMLHGGDYNPDQWQNYSEIINEDMRLIPLAHCNAMSINIFSWTTLEPKEGVYNFSWLDDIMNRLDKHGIKAVLATPSGARPAWMSQAHPEVLRVNADRTRNLHGMRHNHCYTSPYYRMKVQEMNRRLAEHYGKHPALILWHISNEYGGECHCELCQEAFRNWLKEKYHNDLDALNAVYWTQFWSHTYTDWSQIESPSPLGETAVHGLTLDWKRFVTDQTISFIENEIAPLKETSPDIPVTTNLMGTYDGLNYFRVKNVIDIVSWDNYPDWHVGNDVALAKRIAFMHDLNRSLKDKPFLMMESTPSMVNWKEINKLKRPGMHMLSSMQAIAHGADSVQYFQWRKSRGSVEKLHGAVVDHCGHEHTRVFRDVAEVGKMLEKLDDIVGSCTPVETAVVFDWENRWAIYDLQGMGKHTKKPEETCVAHYGTFWDKGINVDIIDSQCDFSKYRLVVAPMLYMLRPGVEKKIEAYVKNGGVIVCTYCTGWVDENDLCYLGGFPGGILKEVFGIWAEELDTLAPEDRNLVTMINGKSYQAMDYCELIHARGAEILGTYQQDFYAGMPAVTCNQYGRGRAYYIAFRDNGTFLQDFYRNIIECLKLSRAVEAELPAGVTAHTREDATNEYLFLENYNTVSAEVPLVDVYTDMCTDELVSNVKKLLPYGCAILKRTKR